MQDCLAAEPEQDGFRIQRRFFHGGRPLRFGGFRNDAPVRLYRRDIGQLEIRAGQIEVALAPKKTGALLGKLMCDMDSNLEQQISQLNRLTTLSADLTARRQLDARSRTHRFGALASFLRSYVLQLGFLDGQIGLNAAWQLAFARHGGSRIGIAANSQALCAQPVRTTRDDQWDGVGSSFSLRALSRCCGNATNSCRSLGSRQAMPVGA